MKKPSLLIIFLTVFIDLIGFGIVLPLLPRYSERFGATGFKIGLIIGSYSCMQFFFAPLWGRLSDRIGRRPVLLISNAGSAISYALFAVAAMFADTTGLVILVTSRVFAGVCGANLSVASAYIADVTTPENRSKGMGMIGMAFGLGFILGPAIGGLSAKAFGLAGPGWIASALCTTNFLLSCVILKESRTPNSQRAAARPRLEQWRHTLGHPRLGMLIGIFFLATFCFTCFETTLPLLLGSSTFHRDDIRDPKSLTALLQSSDMPAVVQTRTMLTNNPVLSRPDTNLSEDDAKDQLAAALNTVIRRPDFYSAPAFQGVILRPKTVALLKKVDAQNAASYAAVPGEPTPATFSSKIRKLIGATDGSSKSGNQEDVLEANRLLLEDTFASALKPQRTYFDTAHISYLFAYCGIIAVLIQGGAIGRLVKSFGEPNLIWGSLVVVAISLTFIPLAGSLGILLLGLGLFAAGSGINRAPTMGLISKNSSADEQGATLGVAQSAGTLARIVGPIFATSLYAIHPPMPYLVCAGIALLTGLLAWKILPSSTAK